MNHIRITVDGTTIMDADPGTWRQTPPDINSLKLKAGSQPWGLAVMATVAETATLAMANKTGRNTTITIATQADGWTMDVEHAKQGQH